MEKIKSFIPEKVKVILRPLFSIIYFFINGQAIKKLSVMLVTNNLKSKELNSPFFVIATRGNLHVIKLCLKFIPAGQDYVIVLNGLEGWEREWAYRHLQTKGFIIFPFLIDHWMVIDYLLNWTNKPFGLIDDDCFVFNRDYFEKIKQFPEKTVISSCYSYKNSKLGLIFPETVFLFINTPVINRVKNQYGLGSSTIEWNQLSPVTRSKLILIGISGEALPEDYKPYFDTLRALMAISVAEKYQFYFPNSDHALPSEENIFHVGAVASVPLRGIRVNKWDTARGSYFWLRALESSAEREIQDKYYKKYGFIKSEDILKQLPESLKEMFERNDFILSTERVIDFT